MDTQSGRIRAAQYLRMSTEHQRYSLESQAATIASYADANNLSIVRTYADAGKSGVSIRGRAGLKRLLADVLTGAADYTQILVYDVSRWGRFQDADQAAHYEFICRDAGLTLNYCAELFSNDGSMVSSVLKHLKRVMAGEYSRELAVKVRSAHRRQAALGFSQGGIPPYGFRRQLVSADNLPKQILEAGERKALASDRVIWVPGPEAEVQLVRRVFKLYTSAGQSITRIARDLRLSRDPSIAGGGWTYFRVRRLLSNEAYQGLYVYGRRTKPFGAAALPTNPEEWTRARLCSPLVPLGQFRSAQRRLACRQRRTIFSDDEMLTSLQKLVETKGRLSGRLVDASPEMPSAACYVRRFGSLFDAYSAVGFRPSRRTTFGRGRDRISDEAMLDELRRLNAAHGFVSAKLVGEDQEAPCAASYAIRFGSLGEAYRLAGLPHKRRDVQLAAARRRREARQGALTATPLPIEPEEGGMTPNQSETSGHVDGSN